MSLENVRKKRGALLALAGGVLAIAVASPGLARPGHGPGRGQLDRLERGVSQLGLEAETQEAVTAVLEEARPRVRALHEEIRTAHQQMREQLEVDPVDESALLEQVEAIGALKTEVRKAELQALLRVRALLSPEEREQLKAMRHEHRGHRGHERGDRRDRGGEGETDV